MRRRIDTHESISDVTTDIHSYLNEWSDDIHLHDPPPALYDEVLWSELVEAKGRLRAVEARVLAAIVHEPLDSVEIQLGSQLWRMLRGMDKHDRAEWSRIEDALREHAKTVEWKP